MSKPHPIIKIPATGISLHELIRKLPSLEEGFKFGLKVKKGIRWKLRAFRISHYRVSQCECCGPYETLSFKNSTKDIMLCSHFGPSYVCAQTILS